MCCDHCKDVSPFPFRFSPQFKILNYTAGKEVRERQKKDITDYVSTQGRGWNKAKFPFHILLAHYEVWIGFCGITGRHFLELVRWR